MGNYIFSVTPTFTQGLILGQLSILVLLYFILKYLFFDSKSTLALDDDSIHHTSRFATERIIPPSPLQQNANTTDADKQGTESAEWLNVLIQQIVNDYRCKLGGDENGAEGENTVLKRVQAYVNTIRPEALLGPIKVHSINLGESAPRLSNSRITNSPDKTQQVEFDLTYTDTTSISLTTSVLFNYPYPGFARLPLSLVISLELFSSSLIVTPPIPSQVAPDALPSVTFTIPPLSISLNLKVFSTMGCRAQLADVPKLHELIENQTKKLVSQRGTWEVTLPGLGTRASSDESDI